MARTVVESKNQLRFLISISKTSLILQDFQNQSTRRQKFLYHIWSNVCPSRLPPINQVCISRDERESVENSKKIHLFVRRLDGALTLL